MSVLVLCLLLAYYLRSRKVTWLPEASAFLLVIDHGPAPVHGFLGLLASTGGTAGQKYLKTLDMDHGTIV